MSTVSVTAGEIMDSVAALLNDVQKQNYTYANQLPYLKIAIKDLRKKLELDNIPVTNKVSSPVLAVTAGTTVVGFNTSPALPSDLVEIQQLWERSSGVDPFVPMTKKEFIPHNLEGQDVSNFGIWAWIGNEIHLLESTRNNDLKIDYIAQLTDLSTLDQNSTIAIINADSYLHYRTAALCAYYIGENESRSVELNKEADLAFDILLGVENKAKQSIATRHRPFRAAFKRRGLR